MTEVSLQLSFKESVPEPEHDENDEGTSSSLGFSHTDRYARYSSAEGMDDQDDGINKPPAVPVCDTAFLVRIVLIAATAGDFSPSPMCRP